MNEIQNTNVMIEFWLIGDDFDVNTVTSLLQIEPTETRQKTDFPMRQFAKVEWSINTNYESSNAISDQFGKLLNQLHNKHKIINKIKKNYNLECGFNVVVNILNNEQPEMVLTREIINFASKVDAEICFDLYYFD